MADEDWDSPPPPSAGAGVTASLLSRIGGLMNENTNTSSNSTQNQQSNGHGNQTQNGQHQTEDEPVNENGPEAGEEEDEWADLPSGEPKKGKGKTVQVKEPANTTIPNGDAWGAAPPSNANAPQINGDHSTSTNPPPPTTNSNSNPNSTNPPAPAADDSWGSTVASIVPRQSTENNNGAGSSPTKHETLEESRSRHASPEKGPGPATALLASSYEVKVTLADQQGDPNSPLYSIKSFEELGLHPHLLKGLYAMKFSKPSKIQEKALPLLLASPPQNMIGQSQSGTGKTAAFSLTMLSRIDYRTPDVVQAICLAPSRELARQIQVVVDEMGQFVPVKTFLGVKEGWKRGQKIEANIVIGTPGTVMDMLARQTIDPKAIKVLVVDEADTMLDQQGLGDHCERARRMCPTDCQVICFSATFPDKVREFAANFAPGANEIKLAKNELNVDGIKQFYMDCKDEESKYQVLVDLYELLTIGQSIIFCKQRVTADRVAERMIAEGHSVASLHGDKDASARDLIIDGFRQGKTKVLITTNVIARGIDIQQVNMVVNYDTPDHLDGSADTETYLHRVGRTGRFGRKGVAILFVYSERTWTQMHQIESAIDKEIVKIVADDFEEMEKMLKAEMKK